MNNDTESAHVTPRGGNVFADLGFDQDEAVEMQAESRRIISEKLAIKEQLMTELADWINGRRLTQAGAAEILGVARPRVSDVVNKKAVKFTIDSLVDMVSRTGRHIRLSVK